MLTSGMSPTFDAHSEGFGCIQRAVSGSSPCAATFIRFPSGLMRTRSHRTFRKTFVFVSESSVDTELPRKVAPREMFPRGNGCPEEVCRRSDAPLTIAVVAFLRWHFYSAIIKPLSIGRMASINSAMAGLNPMPACKQLKR